MTNYFAIKQDHVMKEKQSNILHHHSLLSEMQFKFLAKKFSHRRLDVIYGFLMSQRSKITKFRQISPNFWWIGKVLLTVLL